MERFANGAAASSVQPAAPRQVGAYKALPSNQLQEWKWDVKPEHPTFPLLASHEAWREALLNLTPSGSEFVDEPKRCADFLRQRLDTVISAFREKNALAEENKILRKALFHAQLHLGIAEGRLMVIDASPDNRCKKPFNQDILPGIGEAWNIAQQALNPEQKNKPK